MTVTGHMRCLRKSVVGHPARMLLGTSLPSGCETGFDSEKSEEIDTIGLVLLFLYLQHVSDCTFESSFR